MSSKFISSTSIDKSLQNGTAFLNIKNIKIQDLQPNFPVKTDGDKNIYSTKLSTSDITGLENVLTNPFDGTLEVKNLTTAYDTSPLDLNIFIQNTLNGLTDLNDATQNQSATSNQTTFAGDVITDNVKCDFLQDKTGSSLIEMGSTEIDLNATDVNLNGVVNCTGAVNCSENIKRYDPSGNDKKTTTMKLDRLEFNGDPVNTSNATITYLDEITGKVLNMTVDKGDFGLNSTAAITVDGENFAFFSSELRMNDKKISTLADPTDPQDAATKKYVDENSGGGGSGNVVGPSNSADNSVTFFDGTTGKLIKEINTIKYNTVDDTLAAPNLTTGSIKGSDITIEPDVIWNDTIPNATYTPTVKPKTVEIDLNNSNFTVYQSTICFNYKSTASFSLRTSTNTTTPVYIGFTKNPNATDLTGFYGQSNNGQCFDNGSVFTGNNTWTTNTILDFEIDNGQWRFESTLTPGTALRPLIDDDEDYYICVICANTSISETLSVAILSAITDSANINSIETFGNVSAHNFIVNNTIINMPFDLIFAATDEVNTITTTGQKMALRCPRNFQTEKIKVSVNSGGGAGFAIAIRNSGIVIRTITQDNLLISTTNNVATYSEDALITVDVTNIGSGTATGLKIYMIGKTL